MRAPLLREAALGTALGVALLGQASSASGALTASAHEARVSATAVTTIVRPHTLDAPAGIALDGSGDLFVADSGRCRVVVVPSRTGTFDGLHLHAGHVTTLVGGSCRGTASIGHPSGVAVDAHGDVFVAEATAHRVQVVRSGPRPVAVTVAGTGSPGGGTNGQPAIASALNEPTSVAVDGAGDLFIADTADCVVRAVPLHDTTLFGVPMTAGDLYTVAGARVCGTSGQGGPLRAAQLWNPVAVAIDSSGDLFIGDAGDQSVLVAPAHSGTFFGSTVVAGDLGVVAGGTGSYGPYLADGLAGNGPTAELNDVRGVALGPDGNLYVTDGFMHAVRVVPAADGTFFGQAMKGGHMYTLAGALPVSAPSGGGNATRWVRTHADTPSGLAVSPTGAVFFSDAGLGSLSEISGP